MPHARAGAVALLLVTAGGLSGCSLLSKGPDATTAGPTPTASATPNASPSPSASPSSSPSATPGATEGPIVGEPPGAPVTPEVFLATVDEAAGLLRVIVVVPSIFEDGGTCIVTVKAGSVTVSKQNIGAADATSTACGQFTFVLADLPQGNASVTARYESDAHQGSSGATTVAIP